MAGVWLKRKIKNFSYIQFELRRWYNKKRIKSRDFTIISNNCWAGKAYQYFDMPYLTPTVGLYFFADDYLKFIKNLRYYMSLEVEFISPEKSKYYNELEVRGQTEKPIGLLDDVEIIFLHYTSTKDAKEKWERRKKRINYDNIFIKFSNMNLCTEEHIKEFDELNFLNKFVLNNRKKTKYSSEYFWSGSSNAKEIINDSSTFPGNLNLVKLLKRKPESYPY
ncbi:MAG: DUF1919 domain-containing protein [Ruminococcus sp.]|nr:DUF1919 domain-containing protein [Ruminococcus sp.]